MAVGGVRFAVREDGEDVLVYHMSSVKEAVKTLDFIREFFPNAQFIFEPLRH